MAPRPDWDPPIGAPRKTQNDRGQQAAQRVAAQDAQAAQAPQAAQEPVMHSSKKMPTTTLP